MLHRCAYLAHVLNVRNNLSAVFDRPGNALYCPIETGAAAFDNVLCIRIILGVSILFPTMRATQHDQSRPKEYQDTADSSKSRAGQSQSGQ